MKYVSLIVALTVCFAGQSVFAQKMYWTDNYMGNIYRADLDGSDTEVILSYSDGVVAPWGVALDLVSEKLYWTDEHGATDDSGAVLRANLDGTDVAELVIGLDFPTGITLDVDDGKMYWCDPYADRISRSNLDGSGVEVVISNHGANDIALDLDAGKLYWAHFGHVHRTNLDGSEPESFSFPGWILTDAQGIALDTEGGWMYLANRSGNLARANLDGTNAEVLVWTAEAFGVAVDSAAGELYWTDMSGSTGGRVNRACDHGVGAESLFQDIEMDPRGIALDLRLPHPEASCTFDLRDFAGFQNCFYPFVGWPAGCGQYDFVPGDFDVDYDDYRAFFSALEGP